MEKENKKDIYAYIAYILGGIVGAWLFFKFIGPVLFPSYQDAFNELFYWIKF